MNSPRVSVGLPVYNGERYLPETLKSLVAQDFEDFEIVLSDNASTDATADICRDYCDRDKRIRYFRNDLNIGSAPNYRRVFDLARAPLFKWCAHDDVCFPSFLTHCYRFMESAASDVVLAYPRCEFIDENGETLDRRSDSIESRSKHPYLRFARVMRNVSHGGPLWGLMRREYLSQTQLTGAVSYWDDLLLAELSLFGQISEIPEVLFKVRCYQGNAVPRASTGQGDVVRRNPDKANRQTRQALSQWTDPSSQRTILLPIHEERCIEYWKRARHAPLSRNQKVMCFLAIPAVSYWGRVAKVLGLWRRKLSAGVRNKRVIMRNRPPVVGDLVEVRSKEEILCTLDSNGQLDGMPFMPEMFAFCGKRFRVYKRAHKTCDTVFPIRGRRVSRAIHLETRCDGSAHGGCQAGCLIFWKEEWLKPVESGPIVNLSSLGARTKDGDSRRCTESDVWNHAQASDGQDGTLKYVCQATQLPYATSDLSWWDVRQYVEDYVSGNVTLGRMVRGLVYSTYFNLSQSGIGLGRPMRWLYERVSWLWHQPRFPRAEGGIPDGEPTPSVGLNLQPGELVRVKSHEEILRTVSVGGKNRGMTWDAEMVPYCGGTYRVLKRVSQIVDERTGKMQTMKTPCIILDTVVCQSRYSACRMFCPRSIYSYWREIWLERVAQDACPADSDKQSPALFAENRHMTSSPRSHSEDNGRGEGRSLVETGKEQRQ